MSVMQPIEEPATFTFAPIIGSPSGDFTVPEMRLFFDEPDCFTLSLITMDLEDTMLYVSSRPF